MRFAFNFSFTTATENKNKKEKSSNCDKDLFGTKLAIIKPTDERNRKNICVV